ncbi:SpoIIE family protein phosphatase [Isoptericola aurantiacus]|uniref:SpoIIE family protein phosphatase n=1 Tax=Isoptericola aurantiacus TaxID=3377839 RepID=UPI00383A85C0
MERPLPTSLSDADAESLVAETTDELVRLGEPVEIATGSAVLLLDTATRLVVDANRAAVRLSGSVGLPVPIGTWCAAAGVVAPDDTTSAADAILGALEDGGGVSMRSARSDGSEHLWTVCLPLAGAPDHLSDRALVVLLPASGLREEVGADEPTDGLQLRAAVASHLSFSISDPSQPDDPLIWVNPAFCRVTGYSAEEVLGRNCRFLQGEGTDRATVDRIRAALDAGEAFGETLLNHRKDGTPFWNQVVVSPILDEDGTITHHVGIQTDVTERVHAERRQALEMDEVNRENQRLALLATITQELMDLFDEDAGAALLPHLVAPHFGAWCVVVVVDDRGEPRLVHAAARDPRRAADVAVLEGSQRWAMESPAIRRVLDVDRAVVPAPFPVDIDSLPRRTAPAELEALRNLGLGSAIAVPLRGRDRVIGVMVVISDQGVESFDRADVRDIVALGARGGLALDNARLYRREHEAALTLQHSMLPQIVDVPGLDCAALYEPASSRADVGGDWYDVVPLPTGGVAVSVGDVVGHDIRAAAAMGQLRSVLRSEAWSGRSASEVVAGVDDLVRGLRMADMATCVFALLAEPDDAGRRRATYTRAGHMPPLLLRAAGGVERLDQALTTPIGAPRVVEEVPEAEVVLEPGDALVLFTDGLVERRDRTLRDQLESLYDCACALDGGPDAAALLEEIVEACADGTNEDDTCILVVRNAPVAD